MKLGHYHAEGMYHWDTWYLPVGEEVHMFHLQVPRPGSTRPDADNCAIGHAVTRDMIHWRELPVALRKGPSGSYDEGPLFTGYAVEHAGTIYLFYCGNGPEMQTMNLALSTDGVNFSRWEGNPIIQPDGAQYGLKDCRDLVVLPDPDGEGWIGYVVMRPASGCAIVFCRSRDLIHWEIGDPVFQSAGYVTFEVPEVFKLGDTWYMTALTGLPYGEMAAGWWHDPNITLATIVAEAEHHEGPFREVRDNLLLASGHHPWQGYSARSVLFKGRRLLMFSRSEGAQDGDWNFHGRLSWPVELVPREEGRGLNPIYWSGIDQVFSPPCRVPAVDLPECHPVAFSRIGNAGGICLITATLALQTAAAAGIVLENDDASGDSYTVTLDTQGGESGQLSLRTLSDGRVLQNRWWPIGKGGTYTVRLLLVDGMLDVYLDDLLLINFYIKDLSSSSISLFAEGGTARCTSFECSSAKDSEPMKDKDQ